MHKIQVDSKGNFEVVKVIRTDNELILFSARYLQIYDCFDSLTDAICSSVHRRPESIAEYCTVWDGWKSGEKITRVVGMRDKQGELHLNAIGNQLLDFDAEDLRGEIASEQFEDDGELDETRYYHDSKFLIHECRHKIEV